MTRDEVTKTHQANRLQIGGGGLDLHVVPYDCPGGYAILAPVLDEQDLPHTDLWHLLTDYHVNIFEDLEVIAAAPPIVRIPAAQVAATAVDVPEPAWPTP